MDILKKTSGFTLIEAVVSMIIIMACFAMSSMVYINVVRSDNKRERAMAFTEVNRIATETILNTQIFDQTFDVNGLTIVRHVEPYEGDNLLKTLTIEAYNQKKKGLYSFKQIIIAR